MCIGLVMLSQSLPIRPTDTLPFSPLHPTHIKGVFSSFPFQAYHVLRLPLDEVSTKRGHAQSRQNENGIVKDRLWTS